MAAQRLSLGVVSSFELNSRTASAKERESCGEPFRCGPADDLLPVGIFTLTPVTYCCGGGFLGSVSFSYVSRGKSSVALLSFAFTERPKAFVLLSNSLALTPDA